MNFMLKMVCDLCTANNSVPWGKKCNPFVTVRVKQYNTLPVI